MEFYKAETFREEKVSSTRLTHLRSSSSHSSYKFKGKHLPFQIAQEKNPNLSQEIPKIPPIFLDQLLASKIKLLSLKKGHHVSSVP
jgi:hypothetical protein